MAFLAGYVMSWISVSAVIDEATDYNLQSNTTTTSSLYRPNSNDPSFLEISLIVTAMIVLPVLIGAGVAYTCYKLEKRHTERHR